jgi:uncharacterized protein (UPF0335 family)
MMAEMGHNSGERGEGMGGGHVAADELRLLYERVERLKEEAKGIADDIRDVFAEAKGRGYDPRTMKEHLKRRAMKREEREERDALLEVYEQALGDI